MTMPNAVFIAAVPRSLARALRRFRIRRELKNIRYECDYIRKKRAHDYQVERVLYAREALLRSELGSL
jgi:hypothetical protein